jgi:anti-sigma regulatory factor (Ser/Thr protein kinase)
VPATMMAIRDALVPLLETLVPRSAVDSIVHTLPRQSDAVVGSLDIVATRELLGRLEVGVRLFGGTTTPPDLEALRRSITGGASPAPREQALAVSDDRDVLEAQRCTQAMIKSFFRGTDAVRLTTVVSELTRNLYQYAGGGELRLSVSERDGRARFDLITADRGSGIKHLDLIFSGQFISRTGLGKGLLSAKRFLDEFDVQTSSEGTTIRGCKWARKG